MPKILIKITTFFLFVGVAYWAYTFMPDVKKAVIPQGLDYCLIDSDCVTFGKTGEGNCGCYNKDYLHLEWRSKPSCLAPSSCRCTEGKCDGVFGEINSLMMC